MVGKKKNRIHQKKSNNRTIFFLAFIISAIALLVLVIKNGKTVSSQESSAPIAVIDTISGKADSLAGPNIRINKDNQTNVWWISDDNYSILAPARQVSYSVKFDSNDITSGNPIEHILTRPGMRAFYDLSVRSLKEYGFRKNTLNSSSSLSDTKFYDYVEAYENGDTKCVITVDPDASSTGTDINTEYYTMTTSCTDSFAVAYADQSPILRSLQIRDAVISRKSQPVKDYFVLDINFRRTGHYTVVKKNGNTYTELYSGQDNPPCSLVDLKKVPKKVYGSCYEEVKRIRK